jgi:hypothetical protein
MDILPSYDIEQINLYDYYDFFKKECMDILPSYDIEEINLIDYNYETRNIILNNFLNYTKLKKFYCHCCNLTELPYLSNLIIELDCSYNNLTKLPNLPNSLIELWCNDNKLTKLPKLPNSLIELDCTNNNLTELPDLPNSLIELYCDNNNLTELPDLPNSLTELYCSNNDLTELPSLPNSLIELYCDDNNLTYPNYKIKTINEINKSNFKKKILKRMEVLNRNLLLEHSAIITMNPKRIQRLLNTNEINFYDNSFDTLTN